jgi:hypothetical protein
MRTSTPAPTRLCVRHDVAQLAQVSRAPRKRRAKRQSRTFRALPGLRRLLRPVRCWASIRPFRTASAPRRSSAAITAGRATLAPALVRSAAPGERELRGKANFCPEITRFLPTTRRADQSLCYGLRAPETSEPLWVKSGRRATLEQCPLCAQKRTLVQRHPMSAKCQKRTHALQQSRGDSRGAAVVIRQPESVRSCGAFNSAAFRASRPS